ncbi:hypothetical protein OsJ_06164 [Oryza sativa Japonica Group]|uniref:Uncharacterized protein n=1 Tax=Oryza sativa subsp. japonica TaxID=39947 RepID=B9F4W4_ORYSJ|nr:hypothetical protein OsJ_06164 [Oryza sativa Japonica Group]
MADKDVAVIAGKEEVGDEATAAAALIADKEEVGDEATASATVNGPDKGTRRKVRVMVSVVHEVKAAEKVGEGHPPVPQGKIRLSQQTIDAILATKTMHYSTDALEYYRIKKDYEMLRLMHSCMRTHDEFQKRIVKRKAWIRNELEKKGAVPMDMNRQQDTVCSKEILQHQNSTILASISCLFAL